MEEYWNPSLFGSALDQREAPLKPNLSILVVGESADRLQDKHWPGFTQEKQDKSKQNSFLFNFCFNKIYRRAQTWHAGKSVGDMLE